MGLTWIHESPPYWDAGKAKIVGGAGPGIFDQTLTNRIDGTLLPNDWWRVEDDQETIGYGWMDTTWGDAEILLAVRPDQRGRGVGTFILDRLETEAQERGLHYLYNRVSETHPDHTEVTAWLQARNFTASEDGKLLRAIVRVSARAG